MDDQIKLLEQAFTLMIGDSPEVQSWRNRAEKHIKKAKREIDLSIEDSDLVAYSNRTYSKYKLKKNIVLFDWTSRTPESFAKMDKIFPREGEYIDIVKTHYIEENLKYYTLFKWDKGILYSITYLLDETGKWFKDVNSSEYHIMMLKNRYDYHIPKQFLDEWI